jgi:chorismate lyase/3-hydroxybenzoate synthase
MDGGRDRYMVFNAGRYAAFCQWYGGADQFSKNIPTASGVGHRGADLVIHCLGAAQPGIAVENPRQVPPYRYSKRFGPLPPCFSRATVLDDATTSRVLVGGTASILGEESVHLSKLDDQFRETVENLATLLRAAAHSIGTEVAGSDVLSSLREVRVYFPNATDRSKLEQMLHEQFDRRADVELIEADLCRQELLVEIEGSAELPRPRKLGANT